MPNTTTTQRATKPANAPSTRQLAFLRSLANRTGQTFATPTTWWEARNEIDRLLKAEPTPADDIHRERHEIRDAMVTERGDDAQIRPSELEGHGSTAAYAAPRTTVLIYINASGEERKIQTRRNDDGTFRLFDRGPGSMRTDPNSMVFLGTSISRFTVMIERIEERVRDHATTILHADTRLPQHITELAG